MKKILLIIAISCMPFLTGYAVAADTDTIPDAVDNCPDVDNEDQKDTDGDRKGDACDPKDTVIENPHDRYGFANPVESKRMGFGFAQPIITIIPGYKNESAYKPVVILAGGYDPTKDYRGAYDSPATGDPAIGEDDGTNSNTMTNFVRGSGPDASGTRTPDKVGNAIYFLDAVTGDVVARIEGTTAHYDGSTVPTPGNAAISGDDVATGAGKIVNAGLEHSIPATITPVDSQGDGITDRVYFIDVVGNVWRLDIIPAGSGHITTNWKLNKFASLGADGKASGSYAENERRFFNQIDVVRTRTPWGTNADALLVGSGNIADPKGTTSGGQNAFFMIYDLHTQPGDYTFTAIDLSDLYNVSNDNATGETQGAAVETAIQDNGKKGWYLPLAANEKAVSAATTIDGTTYFTTIVAGPDSKGCAAPETLPASWLYAVNMHNAKGVYTKIVDEETVYERGKTLGNGEMAFQQIEPFVTTGGDVSIVLPGGDEEGVKDEGGNDKKLEGAGSYWRTEDQ